MALIKKLGYCVGSKTTSIDFEEKKIPEKVEYKVIVKVRIVMFELYNMSHMICVIIYEPFLIQTGDTAKAGTDADVRIQLIGYNRNGFKNLSVNFS